MKLFEMVMLRRKGLPVAEIAKQAGVTVPAVVQTLKRYELQTRCYKFDLFTKSKPAPHRTGHPEQGGR